MFGALGRERRRRRDSPTPERRRRLRRAPAGAADDVRRPGLRPSASAAVGRGPHHAGGHRRDLDARVEAAGGQRARRSTPRRARRIGPSSGWTCCDRPRCWRGRRRGFRQPAAQPRSMAGRPYNGSHVWEAIYLRTASAVSDPDDMCYEERVLYRLLSGMHASVNVHESRSRRSPRGRNGSGAVWPLTQNASSACAASTPSASGTCTLLRRAAAYSSRKANPARSRDGPVSLGHATPRGLAHGRIAPGGCWTRTSCPRARACSGRLTRPPARCSGRWRRR